MPTNKVEYAFQGTIPFQITYLVGGKEFPRRARIIYEATPEGSYYDPELGTEVEGEGNYAWHLEIEAIYSSDRTVYRLGSNVPESNDPEWVQVEQGFPLFDEVDEAIGDLIDEDIARQDAERRKQASGSGGSVP